MDPSSYGEWSSSGGQETEVHLTKLFGNEGFCFLNVLNFEKIYHVSC